MKNKPKIFFAIASLTLAALACQAVASGPSSNDLPDSPPENTSIPNIPESTAVPLPTQEEPVANSGALFEDDFSGGRTQWGTGTDADSSVEYLDETLNFQILTENYYVRTTANDKDYENVHMEVTVINNNTNSNTAFGLICYQQFIDDSYYYFAITPAGEYGIAKAALAQPDVFLTNNDEWGDSDLIAKDAASYRVGADCGNGKLTLYVDGQEIVSVDDSTYTTGGFGLFASSAVDAASVNVSFDDFVMTKLP